MARRILIGSFPDGGKGVRVSEPGYDVMSNPIDNERMIFNSDWPEAVPVHEIGETTTIENGTRTVFFPSQGFVPLVFAMLRMNATPVTTWFQKYRAGFWYDHANPYGSQGAAGTTSDIRTYDANYSFIRIVALHDRLDIHYTHRLANGSDDYGMPDSWKVAYMITKLSAVP